MNCEWSAGHDRYTGSVASAIVAYRLPIATQTALIDAWERHQFADFVTIDRDSIRGRNYEYDPGIRDMQFGSRGRACDTVTRSAWTPLSVESAAVLCSDGECVGVPAVCLNVFRLNRRTPIATGANGFADGGLPQPVELDRVGPIGANPYIAPIALATAPVADADGAYAGGSWGAAAGFGYAVDYSPLCDCVATPLCPVPAVPEPMTALLLIGGLAAMAAWSKRT